MKIKRAGIFLVLLTLLIGVSAAGCAVGMDSLEEILQKNDLTAQITYYANGGWFNDEVTTVSRNLYYKENTKALEITEKTTTKIQHAEDVYSGWYQVARCEIAGEAYFLCDVTAEEAESYLVDGAPALLAHNGGYAVKIAHYEALLSEGNAPALLLGERFEFANYTMKKGDLIYLAPLWLPNQKVEYVLFAEDCTSVTVTTGEGEERETTEYAHGSVIGSVLFDSKGQYSVPTDYNLSPVSVDNATFVEYYVYEEGAAAEDLVRLADQTRTISRPEDGTNVKIYVKYVAGDWEVLRFGEDFKRIFAAPSKKYYLSRDVDCSEEEAFSTVSGTFSGMLRGNGYTVRGLKAKREGLTPGSSVALFGTLGKTAVVKDVTFENLSLICTTKKSPNSFVKIYLLAHALQKDATPTLSNVKMSGVSLQITLGEGSNVENVPYNGTTYDDASWWVGGTTNQAFLAAYPTFQIENYQLIINGETVAENPAA